MSYGLTKPNKNCSTVQKLGGWTNMQTGVGAGASAIHWKNDLMSYVKANEQLLMHCPMANMRKFPSEHVLIIVDDANALQAGEKYGGLQTYWPAVGKTALEAYEELFLAAVYWSSAVYVAPNCADRFRMDKQLDADADVLKKMASEAGMHTINGRSFWTSLAPFCISRKGQPEVCDWWHHAEPGDEGRLAHFWDRFLRKIVYYCRANSLWLWERIMVEAAAVEEPKDKAPPPKKEGGAAAVLGPTQVGEAGQPAEPEGPVGQPAVAKEPEPQATEAGQPSSSVGQPAAAQTAPEKTEEEKRQDKVWAQFDPLRPLN